ncbi:hypothetical protein B0H12DRAFT_1070038 [Mycena haematopus]|nr:hypothetical protein B0H12DRAFT_1070038 [Mycena haematopus]
MSASTVRLIADIEVYNRRQDLLEELYGCDGRDDMEVYLASCSVEDLFWVGVRDETIWMAVVDKLHSSLDEMEKPVGITETTDVNKGCPILRTPPEIASEIMRYLDVRDLCALAFTCRKSRKMWTDQFSSYLAKMFSITALNWPSFRCMLIHTRAVVTGFFVYHLLFFRDYEKYGFDLRTIDIVVKGRSNFETILDFFTVATPYRQVSTYVAEGKYHKESVRLRIGPDLSRGVEVAIHLTADVPEVSVMKSRLTTSFVWMDEGGITVAYPDMTFSSTAMLSHCRYDKFALTSTYHLERFTIPPLEHGISLTGYHLGGKALCGSMDSCPSVVRSTVDGRTFAIDYALRRWPEGCSANRPGKAVTWCLGSMDCVAVRQGIPFFVSPFEPALANRVGKTVKARMAEAFNASS